MATIFGVDLPEDLYGSSLNDSIFAYQGNDTIYAKAGNDYIAPGYDNDIVYGEDGNDSITELVDLGTLKGGNDKLWGGNGNDTINGGDGNDTIDGGFNLDVMNGGNGTDLLDVTFFAGAYSLNMTSGLTNFAGETAINFENVNTGAGNDIIVGNVSNNVINTNAGNDTINGGDGNDTLNGGDGNDTIDGGFGLDVMNGGNGTDLLDVTFFAGAYSLNMTSGLTNFVGETAINFENVNTGAGNDTIIGSTANNVINTNAGIDTINGSSGNDTINAGAGNDTINGGAGTDRMTDGDGNDIYQYLSTSESPVGVARDIITDFTSGFDKINLSSIDADLNLLGNQAFTFIGNAAFSGTAGQVRFYTSGGNLFVQAEINGDGNTTADMEIQLNALASIVATDFIL